MRKERIQEEGLSRRFVRLNNQIDDFDALGNGQILSCDHVWPVAPMASGFLLEVEVEARVTLGKDVRLGKVTTRLSIDQNTDGLLWSV